MKEASVEEDDAIGQDVAKTVSRHMTLMPQGISFSAGVLRERSCWSSSLHNHAVWLRWKRAGVRITGHAN
jgi:hypothetical protein